MGRGGGGRGGGGGGKGKSRRKKRRRRYRRRRRRRRRRVNVGRVLALTDHPAWCSPARPHTPGSSPTASSGNQNVNGVPVLRG